jgi:hypothetical protein
MHRVFSLLPFFLPSFLPSLPPSLLSFLPFFFCGTRVWNQGFSFARQVFYHLSHFFLWKSSVYSIAYNSKAFFVVLGFEFRASCFARQVLYHLSHTRSPFCFVYFSDKVTHFCLGLASDFDPPPIASHMAGMTDVHHFAQLICWDGISLNFAWPQTVILPVSASQISGIISVSHDAWPWLRVFVCVCVLGTIVLSYPQRIHSKTPHWMFATNIAKSYKYYVFSYVHTHDNI